MPHTATTHAIREAVCVFENREQLDAAITELETTAFPRQDISVLASSKRLEEELGTAEISAARLEDNPSAPRDISVRPEEQTILSTAFIGACAYIAGCASAVIAMDSDVMGILAAIAGGSLIGALIGGAAVYLVASFIKQDSDQKIRRGGLVLWVRTPGPDKEQTAKTIMRKHGGRNVHIHSIT